MIHELPIYKNIDTLIALNISFVIYRLPHTEVPLLIADESDQHKCLYSLEELNDTEGFIIAPFKPSEQNPIVCISPTVCIEGEKAISNYLLKFDQLEEEVKNSPVTYHPQDYFSQYSKAFQLFFDALKSSEFQKLVLSRPHDKARKTDFSPAVAFGKALELYPSAFVYLCHTPQTGTWLGSSPELLITGKGSEWKTVALAGTQKIKPETEHYTWDEKNSTEQEIVSGYIRRQLNKCNLEYTETPPQTIEAGKLIHLKTDFSFQLSQPSKVGSLLNLLHPTPAICGLPKEEAYKFIVENEGYDRSYYSGFIGYLSTKSKTDLYVNLRCMKIHSDHLTLYAGGGLLPSSELEPEWKETEAKLQTMLSLIN